MNKINDICNPRLSLNLDENENSVENEDEKIYFIPKKIIYRYKNLSHIFRIQSEKKKREGQKNIKNQKKQNFLIGIKIILLVKFKYIILLKVTYQIKFSIFILKPKFDNFQILEIQYMIY